MGYWGWRPLALTICVCVWVAGCNLTGDASPSSASPTAYPRVTLTVGRPAPPRTPTQAAVPVTAAEAPTSEPAAETESPSPTPALYIVQTGDTLLDIALRFDVSLDALRAANDGADLSLLQIGQTLIIPAQSNIEATANVQASPTPLALSVQPPTCYDTRAETILCLGQVVNTQDTVARRVTLEVHLLRPGGEAPLVEIATLEQVLLMPGELAPYRALFATPWSQFTGATASLMSADGVVDSGLHALTVEDQQAERTDGSYRVTAMLVNTTATTVQPLRAVVTLQDESGAVIGYRVAALQGDALPPGSGMPLEVDLVPQVYPSTAPRLTVYAEALGL